METSSLPPSNPRPVRSEPRFLGSAHTTGAALISSISAARWLLFLVILAGIYFFYTFVVPVLAALVIAFASWPLYRRLLDSVGGNRTKAAAVLGIGPATLFRRLKEYRVGE